MGVFLEIRIPLETRIIWSDVQMVGLCLQYNFLRGGKYHMNIQQIYQIPMVKLLV